MPDFGNATNFGVGGVRRVTDADADRTRPAVSRSAEWSIRDSDAVPAEGRMARRSSTRKPSLLRVVAPSRSCPPPPLNADGSLPRIPPVCAGSSVCYLRILTRPTGVSTSLPTEHATVTNRTLRFTRARLSRTHASMSLPGDPFVKTFEDRREFNASTPASARNR